MFEQIVNINEVLTLIFNNYKAVNQNLVYLSNKHVQV